MVSRKEIIIAREEYRSRLTKMNICLDVIYQWEHVEESEETSSRVNYFVIFAAIVAFMASCSMTYTDVII